MLTFFAVFAMNIPSAVSLFLLLFCWAIEEKRRDERFGGSGTASIIPVFTFVALLFDAWTFLYELISIK